MVNILYQGFIITAVGSTTNTSRLRRCLNAFTVAHGEVKDQHLVNKQSLNAITSSSRTQVRGKSSKDTKTGIFHPKEKAHVVHNRGHG